MPAPPDILGVQLRIQKRGSSDCVASYAHRTAHIDGLSISATIEVSKLFAVA